MTTPTRDMTSGSGGQDPRSAAWRLMIPVDRLHPNPDNPRTEPGDLDELRESILASGLQNPILVRPYPSQDGHYYIEDGWRRWLAMQDVWTAMPAVIRPPRQGENSHVRSILTALLTSVHDKPLNPMERARAYGRLRTEFGMSMTDIAKATGQSPSTVSYSVILLELAPASQEKVASGVLPVGEAIRILRRERKAERRRKTGGSGRAGAVWEPDWLTVTHVLAMDAEARCDTMQHNLRRRIGRKGAYQGACGQCWEAVIRKSERDEVTATAEAAAKWHQPT
jgi:ParB/RepB/Spo0J family partition protein